MSKSKSGNSVLKTSETRYPNVAVQRVTVFKRDMLFQCQQAHGTSTGLISEFLDIKELYQKIADCYDFSIEEILFCTRNTRCLDMDNIVTTVLYHDDFIFVHRKGSKKEIKLTKSEDVFGFTLVDNGNGYTIVKQIKDGSIIDSCKAIKVGDHIEQIGNDNMVGLNHQEVSNYLKSITIGKQIVMYLVEPRKILDDMFKIAIKSIGKLLKNNMGITDVAVAHKLFEMALGKCNTMELAAEIDSSDLEQLGITDDFLIQIWGIVTDAKAGRLIDQGNDASD